VVHRKWDAPLIAEGTPTTARTFAAEPTRVVAQRLSIAEIDR
jgi:hypothetical protein